MGPLVTTIGELTQHALRAGSTPSGQQQLPAGAQRTSGGTWDPTAPNVHFLAGSIACTERANNPHTLVALSEVMDPKSLEVLDRMCDERAVFLDSGVFAFAHLHARQHNLPVGQVFGMMPEELPFFPELYDRWCEVATRFADRLWGIVEIDLGGVPGKDATRARALRDTGLVPMPVYHPLGDGWDRFDHLARSFDRICVGNLGGRTPTSIRSRVMWTVTERARAYPHLWMHLLGVTPSQNTLAMNWRGSCDSSTWLGATRWSQSWPVRALLQRTSSMAEGMWFERGDPTGPNGWRKAEQVAAAQALFLQRTVESAGRDTHPALSVHPAALPAQPMRPGGRP